MAIVKFRNRPVTPLFPSLIDDFLTDDFFSLRRPIDQTVPATSIEETEAEFRLEMAVPGLSKEDIIVEVDDNKLRVSAEKEKSSEESEKNYTRKEYSFSSFERSFTLPENATGDVKAKYEDGVLNVTLPKKKTEIVKSKKIKIS